MKIVAMILILILGLELLDQIDQHSAALHHEEGVKDANDAARAMCLEHNLLIVDGYVHHCTLLQEPEPNGLP